MEAYPRTLPELEEQFSMDQQCAEYLYGLRWPEGFVCPRCQSTKAWFTSRGLCTCAGCHDQVSVKAGTLFDRSRLPRPLWFHAIWWVTSQKISVISSVLMLSILPTWATVLLPVRIFSPDASFATATVSVFVPAEASAAETCYARIHNLRFGVRFPYG
jgi:hypothetical protein